MHKSCLFEYEQLSYALGLIIFPDDADLQLVLFVVGVCLVGGVSNLWTLILGGNFELSIIMSILNTLIVCGELKPLNHSIFDTKKMYKCLYFVFQFKFTHRHNEFLDSHFG